MALRDKIRNAVTKANQIVSTKGRVTADVTHLPWIATTGKGVDTLGTGVPLKAIVEPKVAQYYKNGQLVQQTAILTFLEPITPNGAAKRKEPIDPRDHFVLDNGEDSPIIDINNELEDSATGAPYLHVVRLGRIISTGA